MGRDISMREAGHAAFMQVHIRLFTYLGENVSYKSCGVKQLLAVLNGVIMFHNRKDFHHLNISRN
jgi:hypothetical protein